MLDDLPFQTINLTFVVKTLFLHIYLSRLYLYVQKQRTLNECIADRTDNTISKVGIYAFKILYRFLSILNNLHL